MSTRRRGSSLGPIHGNSALDPGGLPSDAPRYTRRRTAVTTSDYKNCALVQTRFKLRDVT